MAKEIIVCGATIKVQNSVSIYNQITSLNLNQSLSSLIDYLDEDLLQIEFSNGNIVDIGWYPSFDDQGQFVIYAISDNNWDAPCAKFTTRDGSELIALLKQSIAIASK
ncbi:hypothetical protein LPW36_05345 [Jinshanibacter sp. LJY008]|uniref:Uncharacterized protein n=1 Tax=Limnobaculum eriocheiris TaxID=2897391 RepID=A0A9X1MTT8_9GAMM|nr:hypothetical protein [Limnobaculum eriocheiris]MCD1125446.1 hypothetical protein [Limnobaculum eriocheiris]